MLKNSIFIVCIAIISGLTYKIYLTEGYSDTLEQENISLNETIDKYIFIDSLAGNTEKELADVITKYVSDCGFKIGDKSITSEQIVDMFNNANHELDLKDDTIFYLRSNLDYCKSSFDSISTKLSVLKAKDEFIRNHYGNLVDVELNGNQIKLIRKTSKIDSALILLPYYRKDLSKDEKGNWILTRKVLVDK